ncbi:uncharacterized protein EV422DRAFT_19789 [Fimicolochytrium jonesii]|uniref:uncharacterized protein n=1 Tax=Fimicolochytrium jonesii TaxID=1396493 RepID=UPI0022FE75EA|nr:uncharacterized protein EV422DRAFT_19789 [Fimicolochytrium jonesii]KAI8826974.1 hypothetical protein EV422DRAFT_19789 [Fimicolochytrium jonesii]
MCQTDVRPVGNAPTPVEIRRRKQKAKQTGLACCFCVPAAFDDRIHHEAPPFTFLQPLRSQLCEWRSCYLSVHILSTTSGTLKSSVSYREATAQWRIRYVCQSGMYSELSSVSWTVGNLLGKTGLIDLLKPSVVFSSDPTPHIIEATKRRSFVISSAAMVLTLASTRSSPSPVDSRAAKYEKAETSVKYRTWTATSSPARSSLMRPTASSAAKVTVKVPTTPKSVSFATSPRTPSPAGAAQMSRERKTLVKKPSFVLPAKVHLPQPPIPLMSQFAVPKKPLGPRLSIAAAAAAPLAQYSPPKTAGSSYDITTSPKITTGGPKHSAARLPRSPPKQPVVKVSRYPVPSPPSSPPSAVKRVSASAPSSPNTGMRRPSISEMRVIPEPPAKCVRSLSSTSSHELSKTSRSSSISTAVTSPAAARNDMSPTPRPITDYARYLHQTIERGESILENNEIELLALERNQYRDSFRRADCERNVLLEYIMAEQNPNQKERRNNSKNAVSEKALADLRKELAESNSTISMLSQKVTELGVQARKDATTIASLRNDLTTIRYAEWDSGVELEQHATVQLKRRGSRSPSMARKASASDDGPVQVTVSRGNSPLLSRKLTPEPATEKPQPKPQAEIIVKEEKNDDWVSCWDSSAAFAHPFM